MGMTLAIAEAHTTDDIAAARTLFAEYAAGLDVDLSFQEFDDELAALPGDYAPPAGCILLARDDGALVGCVAVRPFAPQICEMKRLYVRPAARGRDLGRQLARRAVDEARRRGYQLMRLDTLPSMKAALALYKQLGFVEIAAYRHNPVPGTRYLELILL